MKRTKKTIDGVSIIIEEDDELGENVVELCGELADEADRRRLRNYD